MATHFQGDPTQRRALDLFIKLMRAAESVGARTLKPIECTGLTAGQFGVLEALWHLGPMTLGDLARKHLRSPNNLTVIVDNLERDGLARRERDAADRRRIIVHLTDRGREQIAAVFPLHAASVAQEMAILTEGEQDELARLLRIIGRQER